MGNCLSESQHTGVILYDKQMAEEELINVVEATLGDNWERVEEINGWSGVYFKSKTRSTNKERTQIRLKVDNMLLHSGFMIDFMVVGGLGEYCRFYTIKK